MNSRGGLAALLAAAWLLASACQPVTREKPEWFILETYQAAVSEYKTMSVQVVRLGADGKESGQTTDVILARPNLLRMEMHDSGRRTGLWISDGNRVSWTGVARQSEGKAPERLDEIDLEPVLDILVDSAPVLALEQVESTTERLNGSEVVRVRGVEAAAGRSPVQVVIWISPDSGLPLRYRRTEGTRAVLHEFRNYALDAPVPPEVFQRR